MPGKGRRILIVVENLPVPLDRRVWLEATTLQQAGYEVSVIAMDALTGEEIESASTSVEKKADVLGSLGRLSAEIRSTLGDTTPESAQLAPNPRNA